MRLSRGEDVNRRQIPAGNRQITLNALDPDGPASADLVGDRDRPGQ
jgi:hypothetical protein